MDGPKISAHIFVYVVNVIFLDRYIYIYTHFFAFILIYVCVFMVCFFCGFDNCLFLVCIYIYINIYILYIYGMMYSMASMPAVLKMWLSMCWFYI